MLKIEDSNLKTILKSKGILTEEEFVAKKTL